MHHLLVIIFSYLLIRSLFKPNGWLVKRIFKGEAKAITLNFISRTLEPLKAHHGVAVIVILFLSIIFISSFVIQYTLDSMLLQVGLLLTFVAGVATFMSWKYVISVVPKALA